jgi:hypothetical protein
MGSAARSLCFAASARRTRRGEAARFAGQAVRVLMCELEAQLVPEGPGALDLILSDRARLILYFHFQAIRGDDLRGKIQDIGQFSRR